MKSFYRLAFSCLIISFVLMSVSRAQDYQPPRDTQGRPLFELGGLTVKLRTDPGANAELSRTAASFGLSSLDAKLARFEVKGLAKRFQSHPKRAMKTLPDLSRIYKISFPVNIDPEVIARELRTDPNVEYAEPVFIRYKDDFPNDSLYAYLQHLPQIMAEEAWAVHKGENGDSTIVLGIVDTGVEWYHPDLALNIWQNLGEDANHNGYTMSFDGSTWVMDPGDLNGVDNDGNGRIDDLIGWDIANNDKDPNTGDSHGTHVAGIAGGVTNNGKGIASISWNVKIMPVACWKSGTTITGGYDGIIYAAENGADVINTSWGGLGYSQAEEEVIEYAAGLGSIIVASAGNNNNTDFNYPGSYPNVVSVAAVARDDGKTSYSSYGISVDVSAPGGALSSFNDGGILSTGPSGTYLRMQGTSMASPLVTGMLGLIKSYHPTWTRDRLVAQLIGTTDNIDSLNAPYLNNLGSGRINAYRALTETSVQVPQNLRLDLREIILNDEAGRTTGSPGDTLRVGLTIRNYAPLVSSNAATFTISSADPSILIVVPSCTQAIAADGYTTVPGLMKIAVKPGSQSHIATIDINIQADKQITFGQQMTFQLTIAAGGVFVWEGIAGGTDYSGVFFSDFLKQQGVPVAYSSQFPKDFYGFDAVFLSFGNYGSFLTLFDDSMAAAVKRYLHAGGKLYLEGSGSLGSDHYGDTPLLSLFGIGSTAFGSSVKSPLASLLGQVSALTQNMSFTASHQTSYRYINQFTPAAPAIAAFVEPGYGTVAVQNSGSYGQKTFASSYVLSQLVDRDSLTNRYNLVLNILNFFGISASQEYISITAEADTLTGNAPLTVHFTDRSTSNRHIISRAWDFNNDGITESADINPSWTYSVPGVYTISLTDSVENSSVHKQIQNFVHVFNGESSLEFNGTTSFVDIPPAVNINLTDSITFEAWIYPTGWGEAGPGFGRVIDKNNILVFLEEGGFLVFDMIHADGHESRVNSQGITLNKWQHIAATYDGMGTAHIYVNGVEQALNQPEPPGGKIMSHVATPLVIGNNTARNRTFLGRIDEISLWHRIRSGGEIYATRNDTLTGTEKGLVGYWRMNEGKGVMIRDGSASKNNGTMGNATWNEGWSKVLTDVSINSSRHPDAFSLEQNYPNPFNPVTTLEYTLPRQSRLSLKIYNVLGQLVTTLFAGVQDAGKKKVEWNAGLVASGVYFYRLDATSISEPKKGYTEVKKMLLVR